jgi:hypothetical protein
MFDLGSNTWVLFVWRSQSYCCVAKLRTPATADVGQRGMASPRLAGLLYHR